MNIVLLQKLFRHTKTQSIGYYPVHVFAPKHLSLPLGCCHDWRTLVAVCILVSNNSHPHVGAKLGGIAEQILVANVAQVENPIAVDILLGSTCVK